MALQHPCDMELEKAKQDLVSFTKVKYGSQYLEEKIFPHLFWNGTGGYYTDFGKQGNLKQHLSHGEYVKMRLGIVAPHFRSESNFNFFHYDLLTKERIQMANFVTVDVNNLVVPLNEAEVRPKAETNFDPYD